jgi:Co/Zn/Cd efflux system component
MLWAALIGNLAMFGVELVGGLGSGSVSLLADAVDFFGDATNCGISLLVLGMALTWRVRAALFKGLTTGVFGTGSAWPDLAVAAVMGVLALTAARSVIQQARAELSPVPAHA